MPIPLPYTFATLDTSNLQDAVDSAGDRLGKAVPISYLDQNFGRLANAINVSSSAPSSPFTGMLWLDTSQSPYVLKMYTGTQWYSIGAQGAQSIIDLTNATSDYSLNIGQVAKISFSNTQNVYLHIATISGTYYAFHLIPLNSVDSNVGGVYAFYLAPNNTTYSDSFRAAIIYRNTDNLYHSWGTASAFTLGFAYSSVAGYIINLTSYKEVKTLQNSYATPPATPPSAKILVSTWMDSTTPWTSLGLITSTTPISGFVLVQRLL